MDVVQGTGIGFKGDFGLPTEAKSVVEGLQNSFKMPRSKQRRRAAPKYTVAALPLGCGSVDCDAAESPGPGP